MNCLFENLVRVKAVNFLTFLWEQSCGPERIFVLEQTTQNEEKRKMYLITSIKEVTFHKPDYKTAAKWEY